MGVIGYFVNDRFCLDDRTPAGINVMLFGGKYDMDYWFDEFRCETPLEVEDYIETCREKGIEMERLFDVAVDPLNVL